VPEPEEVVIQDEPEPIVFVEEEPVYEMLNDYEIPVKINVTQSELEQLLEKYDHIFAEFKDLKTADAAYEGT